MRRRYFLAGALAAGAAPAFAQTQAGTAPAPSALIEPANALEFAFVSALTNANMRPVFRQYLVDTHVVLALTEDDPESAPLEVDVRADFRAAAIFTSIFRINDVFGEDAPRIVINGRAALERLRGKNVVINYQLAPMLTLEPEDVASYLETPGQTSAGPSQ